MHNSRKKRLCVIFTCLACIGSAIPIKGASALVKVTTNQELRQVLAQEGIRKVELQADLMVDGPMTICGEKQIDGQGHCITRSSKRGQIYGGSLFVVQKGRCEWKNVTISGGGASKAVIGKVFGRLIEVRQGMLVIGEGCVLCDNINDRLAVDGGGALQIGAGGSCVMKAGVIRGNATRSKGAGVAIENGGRFTMTGGSIRNNRVVGAGVAEGFDGRGGAIYNNGKLVIKGGTIQNNRAKAYTKDGVQYGGAGSAVYAEAGSSTDMSGGRMAGNRDDRRCPIWMCGQLTLSGRPVLARIYLDRTVVIRSNNAFRPAGSVEVEPAAYVSGTRIAEGRIESFSLVKKNGYGLERKGAGIYIVRKKKGSKVPSSTLPKTPKKKVSRGKIDAAPIIQCKRKEFVFSVGEEVDRDALMSGVSAIDSEGGDITNRIRILEPEQLHTDRVGKGEIVYEVESRRGIRVKKKGSYRIQKNRPPMVRIAPRFLFLWEVEGYTEQQWKELLLDGCVLSDDCESSQELAETTTVEYMDLKEIKAGYREIALTVQDQSGHRFYMKKGEKRRYGAGKRVTVKIPVTLVDHSEQEGVTGHVQSVEPDQQERVEEEWVFSSEQVRGIQNFMDEREDPFALETNHEFLRLYGKCRKRKEESGDE